MKTFPGVQVIDLLFSRFGVAEQAINAIYLLGEQPDKICDDIIKNLTIKVFNAPPEPAPSDDVSDVGPSPSPTVAHSEAGDTTMDVDDAAPVAAATLRAKEQTTTDMGDAFKLSQLVFAVGHVAIKHIVYLELIERELKRRKEAPVNGTLTVRGLGLI
jgi:condensin complex subunit 1